MAFHLTRPSSAVIERCLRQARQLPLSYEPTGLAMAPASSFDVDEQVVTIGRGEITFERAKTALRQWRHFDLGWVEVFPRRASVAPGTVVAVLIRHLGFWSLNGARVVYAIGDDRAGEFGFAYGTLTDHAEMGEELFKLTFRPDSGEVAYVIRAASKPRAALARLGYPVVRSLQARFRTDSARAMQHAVGA